MAVAYLGDVAGLGGQILGPQVHVVHQSFQVPPTPPSFRLAPHLAFRAAFARHAGDFRGKRLQLVHHHVDSVLQFEDLTLALHRDFLGEVAVRHRRS